MTPRKKKDESAFTSLRVIGRKAQRMIESARTTSEEERKKDKAKLPKAKVREEVTMHLSVRSVVRATFAILAIVVGTLVVIQIRDKIILFGLAMFIAAIIDPGVQALERWGIPRALGVLVHYFLAIFLILFLLVNFIPIVMDQVREIVLLLSVHVDSFLLNPSIDLPLLKDSTNEYLTNLVVNMLREMEIDQATDALKQFGQNLPNAAAQSWSYLSGFFGSVAKFFTSLIVVLVLAFFMQLEKEKVVKWFLGFVPSSHRLYVSGKTEAIHGKISQWATGQLLLCFSIFVLTFAALFVLDMEYKLTLAVLAGFCEFIPAVGPFIAAVPAVLIATTNGGIISGVVVALIYYVIQWCENNLLIPLIMRRAVGLSPIAILFAMLVGISFSSTIHPVLGVILAIPTTTIISIFLEDWRGRDS